MEGLKERWRKRQKNKKERKRRRKVIKMNHRKRKKKRGGKISVEGNQMNEREGYNKWAESNRERESQRGRAKQCVK